MVQHTHRRCYVDISCLFVYVYWQLIDTYVEFLKSEHVWMYGDDELADKSYFFNSVCLVSCDIMKCIVFVLCDCVVC